MKRLCVVVASLCALSGSFAQTNVGVSIGISQPGVYGQITLGNFPPPRVINQQPVIIVNSPVRDPLYMYVPPGHQKKWAKHCKKYNACGRPVYFVREDWVKERYEQDRRERGDHDHGNDNGQGKNKKHKD